MLESVIGLEIHLQLKTKTKMFCGCATHDSAVTPNQNVCPVCTGQPGSLPVPNEQAIRFGIRMGLALHCRIAEASKFDRKNYFYPDLPKGYQISQYDQPIASDGFLTLGEKRIGITRAHLEEDAAKNLHGADGKTYVDFNRAGTPLLEIVTEPDFASPQDAKAFMQELRLIARYLGVSDADMEKGHMRCDANISLRERDAQGGIVGMELHPKTEVKNINSFRNVERALQHEIKRQTELWNAGSPPSVSTTRGWDDATQTTKEQRDKEGEGDYRYFPEPDIPVLALTDMAERERSRMPELPAAKRARFADEYGLRAEDARQICDDPALADFTENVFSELQAWLESQTDLDAEGAIAERRRLANLVSGWLLSKLGGLMAERTIDIRTCKINPENFAEFITLIASRKLNSSAGLVVLGTMLDDGSDPSHIMEDKRLGAIEDEGAIAEIIERVIENNADMVERYRGGKTELLQVLIGQAMKESEGTVDAKIARNMLLVRLENA
ncbi:glutaminyl-tRNA synthase (glutamine-hydrolyzing) subunit B [Candidatus Uhrbacteria bacterium RIFOXYB12_FULL_58_10]|uniref:Aspartyl/glutamyl-tRNA(Asn/Gln) amidotransferase subunit B n=1 Tax=Candidatus Uhrbacteria bacterium RIFOXYB2_FULL_57_15 TaxID=1802422 RepID=A0A1F7W7V0_9BACT|nr:MAG: glutaminyl-tRNA synthase (glutamine-hydrolyzing) subunit B [Candidatus Uhrbacteria bacterium RIFOXYB12_FULL_58_10]OGL98871.1 MAG: glutaminyl-tRNA synthase (glutamine-hydrolyzing) subunit B [Candidatus Uhrbacteria bacterium RIFOXYB2_FULL_57_15]OGL99536.1 MAG: glutaminyl-tRNA synthase (glutamine-hydrolyzing) subunit B [Candidatus Uhrbacteria bacterium RIFOXYC12_FULL_57_11]